MYFQNNYLLVALVVVAYFLITNLWLLVGTVFAVGGSKYIQSLPQNEPTMIGGTPFLPAQLWLIYGIVCFVLFFFTGVTSTLLYVVGVCSALVCAHAGCMDKPIEAEFGDESMESV